MEEKERYEWDKIEEGYEWIRDTEITEMVNQPIYYDLKKIAHLLNQQDKQIKELKLLLKADKKIETDSINGFEKLRQENRQLKQSQKQLAISELEMLHDMFCSTINNRILQNYVCSIIRGEIEELKNDGKL